MINMGGKWKPTCNVTWADYWKLKLFDYLSVHISYFHSTFTPFYIKSVNCRISKIARFWAENLLPLNCNKLAVQFNYNTDVSKITFFFQPKSGLSKKLTFFIPERDGKITAKCILKGILSPKRVFQNKILSSLTKHRQLLHPLSTRKNTF